MLALPPDHSDWSRALGNDRALSKSQVHAKSQSKSPRNMTFTAANTILTTLSVAQILILLVVLHKVRRVHVAMFRTKEKVEVLNSRIAAQADLLSEINAVYPQIQAYLGLRDLIRPIWPLPLLRGWAASPDFLLEIAKQALETKPRLILECSSGASTLILARCCQMNDFGHVFSLEHDPKYATHTRDLVKQHALEAWATVIDAPLTTHDECDSSLWYSFENVSIEPSSVDLLVVDGPPGNLAPYARFPAVPLLWGLLSPNCAILLDDANRPQEQEIIKRWLDAYEDLTWLDLNCEKGCAKLERSSLKKEPQLAPCS